MTWKPDVCLYHGNCDDGFGAAYAVWKKHPDIEFIPCFYGKPLPTNLAGKNVLFVDFSTSIEWIWENSFKTRSMVIIDHHKTAEADLKRLPSFDGTEIGLDSAFKLNWSQNTPEIAVWFDMEKSGATMAWQFFHGTEPPEFFKYLEDRDLWKFELPATKAFSAKLRTLPYNFEGWDFLVEGWKIVKSDFFRDGEIILKAHQANLLKIIEEVRFISISGYNVPTVNAPYHYASDAASMLIQVYKDAPFAASWFYRSDGKVQFSLRSEDSKVDVSEIAKKYGGGGHRNSAGFERLLFSIHLA